MALLVLTAIGTSGWAVAYLLLFGLGTIIGMMLITVGLAWPLAGLTPRFANLPRRLQLASGVISLIAGLAISLPDWRGGWAVRRRANVDAKVVATAGSRR